MKRSEQKISELNVSTFNILDLDTNEVTEGHDISHLAEVCGISADELDEYESLDDLNWDCQDLGFKIIVDGMDEEVEGVEAKKFLIEEDWEDFHGHRSYWIKVKDGNDNTHSYYLTQYGGYLPSLPSQVINENYASVSDAEKEIEVLIKGRTYQKY